MNRVRRDLGRSSPELTSAYPTASQTRAVKADLSQRLDRKPDDLEIQGAFCEQQSVKQGYPASSISIPTSTQDLMDVMSALAHQDYNLYGVSCGTRLLMSLMHEYPDSPLIRSVVLDSSYPLPEDVVNDLAETEQAQRPVLLATVFDACEQDEQCASAYPDIRAAHHITALAPEAAEVDGLVDAYLECRTGMQTPRNGASPSSGRDPGRYRDIPAGHLRGQQRESPYRAGPEVAR